MRSALLLLGGLVLLGTGIGVIVLGIPGAWVLGPTAIVLGLIAKVGGFLLTGDGPTPTPGGSGRTVTTLGPTADRARGASSTGRSSALRRARTARAARATARATEAARAAALAPQHRRGRRAS
ncbi:hypothetical protein [Actinomycetospora lemnae]|uniref:Integral membrane protein n=1 Tax=Actinomycetospora lemnae TaxID=3019891 RepID=A0ABT5SZT6_9PSEU|nr:hypothetical protein [Actinomycetospora sp. DW7H6]MDD7968269.1 hypothetical protein [Actinomycetospora sp. DW7H6]